MFEIFLNSSGLSKKSSFENDLRIFSLISIANSIFFFKNEIFFVKDYFLIFLIDLILNSNKFLIVLSLL